MKTMKTFRLFCMAALAIVMAACSNNDDEIQQPTQQQNKIPFSATIAAPNSDATTRTTYTESGTSINVAWKNGDQIALIHNGVKDVVTVGDPNLDGSAPISGSITAPASDEEDVVLVYPAASVDASGSGTGITPVITYLTKGLTQDGTLDYISNYLDSRRGSGKIISDGGSGGTLKENVKMASQIAIWKLSLQDNATTPNALSATAVTVKVGSTTVAAAAAAAKSDYYLCLVPATMGSGDLTINATVGSDTYTYTKAGGVSLETSKYYQSTVTMTKQLTYPITLSAATSDYIGSVVCSDGNVYRAKTAVPSGKTAIGIVGKVTETGHGLILALQDAASQNWNTINGWPSVTTFAGTTLKQLPEEALGSLKIYTLLFHSLSDLIPVSSWCVAQKSDYEEIFVNLGSKIFDQDGYTYDSNVNAYITTGVGGTAISGDYWSATESKVFDEYAWNFRSNNWFICQKNLSYNVRPVLGF